VAVKPFRDRVEADPALKARLEAILGGPAAQAELPALSAGYLELAKQLGQPVDAGAMAVAVRVERLLENAGSGRPPAEASLDLASSLHGSDFNYGPEAAGRRYLIVQAYPATEYDFTPER